MPVESSSAEPDLDAVVDLDAFLFPFGVDVGDVPAAFSVPDGRGPQGLTDLSRAVG